MSPFPVLRTEFAVLKLYLRRLPQQLLWILLVAVVANVFLLGSSYLFGVIFAHQVATFKVGMNGFFLAVVAYTLILMTASVSLAGLLWRHVDTGLLGGDSSDQSLPIIGLTRVSLFSLALVAGAGAVAYACLTALPFRLHALGLPHPYDTVVVVGVLALGYIPLLLRLLLLLPLVAMDGQKMTLAWRLILKTMIGKTVPLLAAFALQCLICVPFLVLCKLTSWHTLTASSPAGSTVAATLHDLVRTSHLPALMVGVTVLAAAATLLSALQAGLVRHFFGYGAADTPARYQERMIAYDPNEVYVVPAPQENVHGRYEVDAPYFDASLLEEIPDVVPTLPRAYQPEDALPMPPVLTLAPTPSPPVPEQAPPQRRPGIVPTAPAASDSAEMPDWSFIDESRPEDDPLASFGTKAAAAAEDDRTKDDPLEDDPFAGLR